MKLVKTDNLLGHYHICVVEEESGYGYVATTQGHSHEILFTQGQAEQRDTAGNIIVAGSPAQLLS